MTLYEYVCLFESVTPTTKGYSPATIATYGSWLHVFARSLPEGAGLPAFTEAALRGYVDAYIKQRTTHGSPVRPRTLNGMYAAFRAFGAFLLERGLLAINPAVALKRVKLDKPDQHLITAAEGREMLAACDRYAEDYQAALATAVLWVLMSCGVRRSEFLALTLCDYDATQGRLIVKRGKGGKEREVYLCPSANDALAGYLQMRPRSCKTDRLFMRTVKQPLGIDSLYRILRTTWAMAGLDKRRKCTPHTFRHLFCTTLLDGGANPGTVADLAGHSSATVTLSIYNHPSRDGMKQAVNMMENLSPKQATPPAAPAPPTPTQPEPVQPARPRRIDLRDRRLPR